MATVTRVVFALLICATIGAFFVTQRLKRGPAVVEVGSMTHWFSPNGDGRRDRARISFMLEERDQVTVTVVDDDGRRVRELASGVRAEPERLVRTAWDGRADDGSRAPDGRYRLRVELARQGRSAVVPGLVNVDTKPPRPAVKRARPKIFEPGRQPVVMAVRGVGRKFLPRVEVWRTDVAPAVRVAEVRGTRGRRRVVWDGRAGGRPAPPGTYLLVARARDRAGNIGSTPQSLPPEASGAPRVDACTCQPGVTAWRLSAQLDQKAYREGARVRVFVDARKRAFAWRLRRIGVPARGARKVRRGSVLTFRAPEGASGVHLLELRSRGQALDVPLLVQSTRRAPFLVVLPATTWLGESPVDDDFNGFPNRLADGQSVAVPRALRVQPGGFADDIASLLVHLDRAGLEYDLTTDLALAATRDPRPTDRRGVLLLGQAKWLPTDVGRRLRRYALDGGTVAVIGTETLRRQVTPADGSLSRPTALARTDVFGLRIEDVLPEPVDIVNTSDDIRLFEGTDGALSGIANAEPVSSAGRRGELVSAMGTVGGDPVIAAARVGEGLVVRIGVDGWGSTLCDDPERAQITRNAIDLLRGVTPRVRDAAQGCGPEPEPPRRRRARRG